MPETLSENKVEFGLKNFHYSVLTQAVAGITYATPVGIPGAVSLTIDAVGDIIKFYADDCVYYSAPNNQGYDGKLTIAYITNAFRTDILGEVQDKTSKVIYELGNAKTKNFASLFEIDGDILNRKSVYYNCAANRPSVTGDTKNDKTEPSTTELSFSATARSTDSLIKAVTDTNTPAATLTGWYTTVFVPTLSA